MPEIALLDDGDDFTWLMAIMMFPMDAVSRELMRLSHVVGKELDSFDENAEVTLSVSTLRLLLSGHSKAEMARLKERAFKQGIYSGYMLGAIYLMDRFPKDHKHFKRPSIKKAIYVCRQFAISPLGKFNDGEKMVYSPYKIRQCWDEYKPVAHLWAAFVLNQDYQFMQGRWPASSEELETFLGVAAELYRFGTSFIPKATKPATPILDSDDAWIVPKSVPLRALYSERAPRGLIEYIANFKNHNKPEVK